MRSTVDPVLAAETTLMEQGMPIGEVFELLRADDPTTIRRHLELHRERLFERLEEQRRAVDHVERLLIGGARPPRRAQEATAAASARPSRKPIRQDG